MAENIKEKPEVRYSFWNGKPVTFRPATFDDYEAVMEISQDLLLGFDYLPHAYYNYLHNPRAEAWLLELEGQVVCFRVYEVLEHDHCIVGSALRLHPELRGSGIYTFFDYVHKEIMLQKYPNLTHVLGLVAKNRLHDKMLVHGYLTLLEERESIAFQVQVGRHIFVDRLQKKSKSLKSHDVVLLSKKEVVQMLTDDKIKAGLFGSGFIVGGEHFGSPMPMSKANIKELSLTHNVCVTHSKASNSLTSVSSGNIWLTSRGAFAFVCFYGSDLLELLQHVTTQIKQAAVQEPFHLGINISKVFDTQQVVDVIDVEGAEFVTNIDIHWLKIPFPGQIIN